MEQLKYFSAVFVGTVRSFTDVSTHVFFDVDQSVCLELVT